MASVNRYPRAVFSTQGTSGYRLSYKLLLRAVPLRWGIFSNRGHDMPHIHRWRSTGNTTRSWPRRTPSRVRCLWRSSRSSSHGSLPSRYAMARNTSAGLHERCERIFTQCSIKETQDLCHTINFHNQILFKRSFPLVFLSPVESQRGRVCGSLEPLARGPGSSRASVYLRMQIEARYGSQQVADLFELKFMLPLYWPLTIAKQLCHRQHRRIAQVNVNNGNVLL